MLSDLTVFFRKQKGFKDVFNMISNLGISNIQMQPVYFGAGPTNDNIIFVL